MLSSVLSILAFVFGEPKEQALLLLSAFLKSSMRTYLVLHMPPSSFFFAVTQHFERVSEIVAGEMKSASTKEKIDSKIPNKESHET